MGTQLVYNTHPCELVSNWQGDTTWSLGQGPAGQWRVTFLPGVSQMYVEGSWTAGIETHHGSGHRPARGPLAAQLTLYPVLVRPKVLRVVLHGVDEL
jgi:hypothetical protein